MKNCYHCVVLYGKSVVEQGMVSFAMLLDCTCRFIEGVTTFSFKVSIKLFYLRASFSHYSYLN